MKFILQNKNIFFLFLIGFLRNFLIMMPILTLFFQSKGLTMQEIMILQVVFSIVIVVLEVPSGYFADYFKRKYSIILGMFFGTLGVFGYYLVNSFWGFMFSEILLGISASLISGADVAYLYDEMLEKKQEKKFQKIYGSYYALLGISESIAAFISGFIAIISFKITILIESILLFIGFIFSFFLKEHKNNNTKDKKQNLDMKKIIKVIFKDNDKIKYLILFGAILGSSTLVFVWIAQPYWKELGLGIIYFGIVWGILNFLVSLGALFSHKMEKYFSFKQIFIFFWVCSFLFYIILFFTKNLILSLIVSSWFWIFRGLNGPILKDYINKEIKSEIRATVLSLNNLFFRIIFSILSPFIGYFADIYDLRTSLLVSGIIFGILSGIALIFLLFSYRGKCNVCME